MRIEPLRNRRKAADVAEHQRHLAQLSAERQPLGMFGKLLDHRRRQIAAESMAHLSALGLGAHKHYRRGREIDQEPDH